MREEGEEDILTIALCLLPPPVTLSLDIAANFFYDSIANDNFYIQFFN